MTEHTLKILRYDTHIGAYWENMLGKIVITRV